jgi:predicted metal-dependent HD superfamily phosphohydrolase
VNAPDAGVPAPESFSRACRALGSDADGRALHSAADGLLARWSEPHRGYHDTEHLAEVLDRLADLDAATPAAVLAAWFHDAVYSGSPGDDERASAALAEAVLGELGLGDGDVQRVCDLVLATLDHGTSGGASKDPERAALVDADLAILAAAPQRYRRYVDGVRAEYRHVDDMAFASGRVAVLERLVGRERLFTTPRGRGLWEKRARDQVGAEISSLRERLHADGT